MEIARINLQTISITYSNELSIGFVPLKDAQGTPA